MNKFDDDERMPVFGFGAKIGPLFQNSSNCFSITNNFYNPFFDSPKNLHDKIINELTKEENFRLNGPSFYS